MEFMTLH